MPRKIEFAFREFRVFRGWLKVDHGKHGMTRKVCFAFRDFRIFRVFRGW